MAERVVRVRLSAVVADFKKDMAEAAEAVRTVGSQEQRIAQTRQSLQMLGTVGVATGAALAAGIGVAVNKFAEFDEAMSFVAATGADARENLDALRQAALDAGAATVFSATESANAIEEMAKAGLDAREILGGGLRGALDLAAAGGLDVASAAGIAATALKVFNLQGSDMAHVADLLAAGAGKAMGDVTDLSQALAQGGQVAAATGLTIEETTASLAAFASQGLLGSDAGTSFKTMLQRLTPQSAVAREKMEELGVSAYDASGNFVGMAKFAGILQNALKDLTPEQRNAALSVMFGSDAVRAANVIYSEGEKGIRDWIEAVDDQGYAAETAATRLDNLRGDWEAFTGALDTAFISMGEGANGPLRFLIQQLTELVDGFNDLPDWAKQLGLGLAGVAAGIGLVGGGLLLAIPKVNDFREALNGLGRDGDALVGKLGKVARVAGGMLVGFALASEGLNLLQQAMANIGDSAEVTDNKLATAANGAEVLNAALGKGNWAIATQDIEIAENAIANLGKMLDLSASGAQAAAKDVNGVLAATRGVENLSTELGELATTNLPAAQKSFQMLTEDAGLTDKQVALLIDKMPAFKKALTEQATAAGLAADDQTLLNLALGDTPAVAETAAESYLAEADAVSDLQTQLSDLIETINEANGVGQDAISQNIAYQETLAGVRQAIADGAFGLDVLTESGRDNMAMLVELASDSQSAAEAQYALDGSTEAYIARMQEGRQALIDSAVAMGATQEEAQALADKIFAIPSEKEIAILAETSSAQADLDRFVELNNGRRLMLYAGLDIEDPAGRYATGGPVVGPGTGTSDSVYSLLSNGEHVITAAEVQAAGGHGAVEQWRASLRSGGVWQPAGSRAAAAPAAVSASGGSPNFNVVVSSKGGIDLLQYVDVRIEQANDGLGSTLRGS
ncbi:MULTISPECIES: phage tail tape measure protein [unclassified Microbacterium]|uniref:phage tail tape measure protein n=1 Tax=unclassified Microbacterium TaxID=2609290 RepID=UPI00300F8621